jgi:uncharacterized membrane protein YhfC
MEFNNVVCSASQTSNRWVTLILEVKCYMVRNIIKSIFTPNKWCLFSTSEQEVMVILVDSALAVTRLREIKNKTPQFLHKCNLSYARRFMTSHET